MNPGVKVSIVQPLGEPLGNPKNEGCSGHGSVSFIYSVGKPVSVDRAAKFTKGQITEWIHSVDQQTLLVLRSSPACSTVHLKEALQPQGKHHLALNKLSTRREERHIDIPEIYTRKLLDQL